MTKMQSVRVSDRMVIAVSKKEDYLKMVSWVPIIAVGDGEGH